MPEQNSWLDNILPPPWLNDWHILDLAMHPRAPSEKACAEIIWKHWDSFVVRDRDDGSEALADRYPDAHLCPRCAKVVHMRGPNKRDLYQCHNCKHQTSAMALTVLRGSRVPLRLWFPALYICRRFPGAAPMQATQLTKILGVKYDTALRMIEMGRFIFSENEGSIFPSPGKATSATDRLLAEVREHSRQQDLQAKRERNQDAQALVEWFNSLTGKQKAVLHRTLGRDPAWTREVLNLVGIVWANRAGVKEPVGCNWENKPKTNRAEQKSGGTLDLFRSKYK
jgi:hypothetical protein